jgi:hypothetical protein
MPSVAVGLGTSWLAGAANVFGCHELSRKNPWVEAVIGSVPLTIVADVLPVGTGAPELTAGSFLQEYAASKNIRAIYVYPIFINPPTLPILNYA